MGTWSHEPFGNDDATDWACGLEGADGLSLVEEALDRVLEAGEYLEAPEASEAVGAVEVLAKLLGRGTQSDSYTEPVDEWVKSVSVKPGAGLLAKANRALERILGENSELKELWEEAGAEEWLNSITALQGAVRA